MISKPKLSVYFSSLGVGFILTLVVFFVEPYVLNAFTKSLILLAITAFVLMIFSIHAILYINQQEHQTIEIAKFINLSRNHDILKKNHTKLNYQCDAYHEAIQRFKSVLDSLVLNKDKVNSDTIPELRNIYDQNVFFLCKKYEKRGKNHE